MKILKSGLFTTVQDLGRFKQEKNGFSVAGVMNQYLYRLATALVDNEHSAVLEVTMNGPILKFNSANIIVFVAYDAELLLDDKPVPVNTALYVEKGQTFQIKQITEGTRGYLAFYKDLDLPSILNSVATHTRSGIGGYKGRTLKDGDVIHFKDKNINHDIIGNTFPIKPINEPNTIPIIKGLQFDQFTETSQQSLVSQTYKVTDMSDRMGYRLNGEHPLTHVDNADIISEPIAPGSVQIPNNGQPIILLNDRQTIGGYTKIATVSFIGREKLAHLKANDELKFKWISIEDAQIEYKAYFDEIEKDIKAIKQKKYKSLENIRPKSKKIAALIKGK
nr:biotin-dependent carboxyltransferase family protein [Mammaliicoccus sp. Marseille-Q6498]